MGDVVTRTVVTMIVDYFFGVRAQGARSTGECLRQKHEWDPQPGLQGNMLRPGCGGILLLNGDHYVLAQT